MGEVKNFAEVYTELREMSHEVESLVHKTTHLFEILVTEI
jgi:hypothetical protein